MQNSNLKGRPWIHYCWDAETNRPCCKDAKDTQDKMLECTLGAAYGQGEPIPAESTWTHCVPSYKNTLLRHGLWGLESKSFCLKVTYNIKAILGDMEAEGDYQKILNGVRVNSTIEYLGSKLNIHELAVLTIFLDHLEQLLLYTGLGEQEKPVPDKKDETPVPVLYAFLNPNDSLLGLCDHAFTELAKGWHSDDPDRRPWMVLDVLGADLKDQAFQRWTRGEAMRLDASRQRRYNSKFASWPYPLYVTTLPDVDDEVILGILARFRAASRRELGAYAFILRLDFPTLATQRSPEFKHRVRTDLEALFFSTDQLERLNSELTRSVAARAPGKNLLYTAREHMLQQVATTHRHNGGRDPFKALPDAWRKPRAEVLETNPFVEVRSVEQDKEAVVAPAPLALLDGDPTYGGGDDDAQVGHAIAEAHSAVVLYRPLDPFDDLLSPRLVQIPPQSKMPVDDDHRGGGAEVPFTTKQGLSPFMLQRNSIRFARPHQPIRGKPAV